MLICLAVQRKIIGNLSTRRSWYHGRQPEVFLQHDSHELRSRTWKREFSGWNSRRGSNSRFFLKSIRHAKVEILSLKSCFLRKKETKLDANLWNAFLSELFCRRSSCFHVVLLMICIWHPNRVPDPVLRGQPCHTWIKNVWCLRSLMSIPRTFVMYLHHINSLESVNDVVYNSVQIFFTVFFCVSWMCFR